VVELGRRFDTVANSSSFLPQRTVERFQFRGGSIVKDHSNPSRRSYGARLLKYLGAITLLFLFPHLIAAQDTGYIGGTVMDKSGAAVAGADVSLVNAGGALRRTTTTNDSGAYVIPGLPGDTYDLSVTAKGFQKFTATKIILNVGDKNRVDVTLTIGAVTEEVMVTGESIAQVETSSSDLSSTISGKQVNELVLNGRNFTQLVTLSPGVVNQTGTDDGKVGVYGNVSYSMNGGRTEYNNWELDGGDNMDNGSNATLNVYPNPEAIAEFKVLTSNYGAQYGRNGSGTIEVETKSGTSSFHGSAFEYNRNEFFKAKSWAEGECPTCPKAPYRKNDYGYTIGGPIFIPGHYNTDKKKTFFFWSQEWRKENDSTTILQNVPSDAERGGNFSDLCSSTPGQIDSVNFPDCPVNRATGLRFVNDTVTPTATGSALLPLIPVANTTTNGFPAVNETVASPTDWREELIRVDHNITDNYRVTFRYIHDSWQTVVPNPLWGNGTSSFQNVTTNFTGPGTSFVARLNANITPTLLNEFVASYTADHISLTTGGPVALPSGFAMGSIFNNGFGGKLPAISLDSNNAYGGSWGQDSGYFPWHNSNPTYTYRDNMTKILGTHTMQFGIYMAFAQKNEGNSPNVQGILTFSTSSASVTTGNAFTDLLLGNVAGYQQWSSQTQYYNRFKNFEPYFQDDWRVNKRLTLNLGLRVSMFGTYRERYQQAFNFNPNVFAAGNEPTFNGDGSLAQNDSNTANPLNGFQQCGGKGGTFPLVPGSAFPTTEILPNSNPGCLPSHLWNPAPRIGFAFDPKGDGKTAIRGGYGIFYEHTNGNEGNSESLEGSAPLVLVATQSNIASGVNGCVGGANAGYDCIGAGAGEVPFFPLTVVSIPNKTVWPYVQQWNLNVQRELPAHVVVSVAYVGSKGTHLTLLNNGNQIFPVASGQNPFGPGQTLYNTGVIDPLTESPQGACAGPNGSGDVEPWGVGQTVGGTGMPLTAGAVTNLNVACGLAPSTNALRTNFPGYANINTLRNSANSIYHSLQISANRTVGALTFSVAYAYSHSIDDSSDRSDNAFVNAYDIAANRASSTFDMRHNLSLSYVYSLPNFHESGWKRVLLGGWQISGITVIQAGTPFSVTNGLAQGDNAGVGNGTGTGSRPDIVGNPKSTPTPDGLRGPLFYNPAAYTDPQGLTFGTVGRNTLTYPDHVNFDFGVFKKFPINERCGFDFRWENFNIFNHTEYNAINSDFGVDNFLHLSGTHDPRRMQFGLRFYF
jgi:hypothetical protein